MLALFGAQVLHAHHDDWYRHGGGVSQVFQQHLAMYPWEHQIQDHCSWWCLRQPLQGGLRGLDPTRAQRLGPELRLHQLREADVVLDDEHLSRYGRFRRDRESEIHRCAEAETGRIGPDAAAVRRDDLLANG